MRSKGSFTTLLKGRMSALSTHLSNSSRSSALRSMTSPDAVLEQVLGQVHVVLEVGKGHLRLDHPELGQVAGGIGVFGPEGGAEGVDVAERQGEGFALKLAGLR